jgi:HTH-type transcriptional regulator/antitoxin MqsA
MTPFDAEMSEILYGDLAAEVGELQGKRCGVCGEVEFDPESAQRYAEAGDALVTTKRRDAGVPQRLD